MSERLRRRLQDPLAHAVHPHPAILGAMYAKAFMSMQTVCPCKHRGGPLFAWRCLFKLMQLNGAPLLNMIRPQDPLTGPSHIQWVRGSFVCTLNALEDRHNAESASFDSALVLSDRCSSVPWRRRSRVRFGVHLRYQFLPRGCDWCSTDRHPDLPVLCPHRSGDPLPSILPSRR